MYDEAIRQGSSASPRCVLGTLSVNLPGASRALQLAKLPLDVVPALATQHDLARHCASPLADKMQRDLGGLLDRARSLAGGPSKLASAEVFAILIGELPVQKVAEMITTIGKRKLAALRAKVSDRLVIDFEPARCPRHRHPDLVKFLEVSLAG